MFRSGYIALLGAPNAGKSSLANAVVGQKTSVVTAKPQTTRKRIKGIHTTPAFQIIFIDAPGVHRSTKILNQFMAGEIEKAAEDADVLAYVLAMDQALTPEMQEIYRRLSGRFPHKATLAILNKTDRHPAKVGARRAEFQRIFKGVELCPVSAVTREGIAELIECLAVRLPAGPRYYADEQVTDATLREMAAEFIREAATTHLHQEIPYGLAVVIHGYKEEGDLVRIEADLVVEHDSQKGIVIGAGGGMIKKIGSAARAEIEKLTEAQVFLALRVKVDKNWTKTAAGLARYGYGQ